MCGFVLHDDGGDQNQGALQCQSMIGRSDFPVSVFLDGQQSDILPSQFDFIGLSYP